MPNNADLGMTLQKYICDKYSLPCDPYAESQFLANYNEQYLPYLPELVEAIFSQLDVQLVSCCTFTESKNTKESRSPDNFLVINKKSEAKTLSIRTNKNGDKVAPRVVGQCGIDTFNIFFSEIAKKHIADKQDIKQVIFDHIHKMLPVFLDYLFVSDFTVWIQDYIAGTFFVFDRSNFVDIQLDRSRFSFTRDLESWTESTTLKYDGKSIAEIQIHKNRTFKFRFLMKALMEFIQKESQNTETFGMTAEKTICDMFGLKYPNHLLARSSVSLQKKLMPIVANAFAILPKPIRHTGSERGERGEQSKCSYDFELEGGKTLSLKTNTGKMVCPPEVGQPGPITCHHYFGQFTNVEDIDGPSFKTMVFEHIHEMIPIYLNHLFDSDYLLWIQEKKGHYTFKVLEAKLTQGKTWKKEQFSFTKSTLEEWNESNTLKYANVSIGEFQVHRSRNCFKFRFNLENLLKIL